VGAGTLEAVPVAGDAPFLHGLVQGMRCGLLAIDASGRLRLVNRVACRILGLEPVPDGALAAEVLADHPRLVQMLDEAFRLSSLPNRAELELGRDGGKTIGFTLSLVADASGRPAGAALFFKDLTRIEHNEEQERLRDRLAELGQMAASLAHEIRNPLASIEVSCSLLKRRVPGGEPCELLDKIVADVRRLNATVSSSLEFVRPVAPRLEPTALGPLLEAAIGVAEIRSGGPRIAIQRSFRDDLPPFLMDPPLMRQVFENLLLNALEAVAGGGSVRVATEAIDAQSETTIPYRPAETGRGDPWPRAEQFVVIRVADSGAGIDEADLDRIFQPMFTTKRQGSGIGLAVVRKIVNSHGGLIDVENLPGGGAQFSVRLPVVLGAPEARNR